MNSRTCRLVGVNVFMSVLTHKFSRTAISLNNCSFCCLMILKIILKNVSDISIIASYTQYIRISSFFHKADAKELPPFMKPSTSGTSAEAVKGSLMSKDSGTLPSSI